MEKLKFELNDVIDAKFEQIQRNLDMETKTLKSTYDTLSASLQKTNKELLGNFKDKITLIKSMVATYFAKIDTQVTGQKDRVDHIEKEFNKFEANFVNPSKVVEGKMYTVEMRMQMAEQMRES